MLKDILLICTLWLILAIYPNMYGQTLITNSSHFGTKEGLSHRDVQSIYRSSKGFLWIATKYGLNRFDGYNFKWYTHESHNLQSDEINHILEDNDGMFWLIRTGYFEYKEVKSIDIFDPINETSMSFEDYFAGQIDVKANQFESFIKNDKGELCFLTLSDKIYCFQKGKKFSTISIPSQYSEVTSLLLGYDDKLWLNVEIEKNMNVGLDLIIINNQGEELKKFRHEGDDVDISAGGIDSEGYAWYIAFNGAEWKNKHLYKVKKQNQREEIDISKINNKEFLDIWNAKLDGSKGLFHISDCKMWFSFDKTMYSINTDLSQINKIEVVFDYTTSIHTDKFDRIWIGTQFGLYGLEIKENPFKQYFYDGNSDNINITCRGILETKNGKILVATDYPGHILQTDKTKLNSEIRFSSTKNATRNSKTMIQDHNGIIWYANNYFLTAQYPDNGIVVEYEFKPQFDGSAIWAMYEDKNDLLWFVNDRSTLAYLEDGKINYLPSLNEQNNLFYIYQFFEDSKGRVWLATEKGLYVLDVTQRKVVDYYGNGEGIERKFIEEHIHNIYEDEDGYFYLATRGNGMLKWHPDNDLPNQYTKINHFSNNIIYAIYGDTSDNLWLSSDYGIIKYNKKSDFFKTYLIEDGITNNEFNRVSHFQSKDGEIYFGTLNGISSFNPTDFYDDSSQLDIPLRIISCFMLDDNTNMSIDYTAHLIENKVIEMKPSHKFLNLEFSLLNISDVEECRYAYKIDGLEKDWTYQKSNILRLSRLPYGNHTLRVKGQLPNGQWSSDELFIKLKIVKPFYFQLWFILLANVLFFASFIFYLRWRTRIHQLRSDNLQKEVNRQTAQILADKKLIEIQTEKLKEAAKQKSILFSNITHELKTPLTMIIEPIRQLIGESKTREDSFKLHLVKKNSENLLGLVNQLLDISQLEEGKMELNIKRVGIHEIVIPLVDLYRAAAERKHIDLQLKIATNLSDFYLDKRKIEKIISNLLSNAIKFTPEGGNIDLDFDSDENDKLVIICEDTGIGIPEDKLGHIFDRFYQADTNDTRRAGGTGIGLSLVKELVVLMKGTVLAKSTEGQGTRFELIIPQGSKEDLKNYKISSEDKSFELYDAELLAPVDTRYFLDTAKNRLADIDQKIILIIEDNADLRNFIKASLSDRYHILEAENGDHGIKQALKYIPDLIISDIMMPVKDGIQVCEELKSNILSSHIPIILLTAKSTTQNKIDGIKTGADAYLTKPFHTDELLVRIQQLIESRDLLRKKYTEDRTKSDKEEHTIGSKFDIEFINNLYSFIISHIDDPDLSVDRIAKENFISRSQLFRKLKAISGQSPNELIREIRLKKAMSLLKENGKTVMQIASEVGFKNEKYFSTRFKQHFGISPSEVFQSVI